MSVSYISLDEAIAKTGLRMVVVGGVPSPWGEAAKGILHIKNIDWAAVRLVYDDERLMSWAGQRSGPVAVYDDEPPRSGWKEILLLAERLAPTPALLPADVAMRALVLELSDTICGQGGLAWTRRLQLVHVGQQAGAGFAGRVGAYLGRKYGYTPDAGHASADRVVMLLGQLVARLKAQHAAGSRYYVGTALTAADVYAATALAMFRPLPHAQCAMDPTTRASLETRDDATDATLDPVLFAHRDMMYAEHLELPLSL